MLRAFRISLFSSIFLYLGFHLPIVNWNFQIDNYKSTNSYLVLRIWPNGHFSVPLFRFRFDFIFSIKLLFASYLLHLGVGSATAFYKNHANRRQRAQFFHVKSPGDGIIKILKSERYKNLITLSGNPRFERLEKVFHKSMKHRCFHSLPLYTKFFWGNKKHAFIYLFFYSFVFFLACLQKFETRSSINIFHVRLFALLTIQ